MDLGLHQTCWTSRTARHQWWLRSDSLAQRSRAAVAQQTNKPALQRVSGEKEEEVN